MVESDTSQGIVFCKAMGGLYLLDVSDPTNPTKISEIHTEDIVGGLSYDHSTKLLYIVTLEAGLEIWDISDPYKPYFYIVAGNLGIRIIKVSQLIDEDEKRTLHMGSTS